MTAVTHQLALVNPVLAAIPPNQPNIKFKVSQKVTAEEFVLSLKEEIEVKRDKFPKTIVYVRTYADCGSIYFKLKQCLGHNFTHPSGYPNHREYRLVDMFTAVSTVSKKEEVLETFKETNSKLCLVIATTAFGMG